MFGKSQPEPICIVGVGAHTAVGLNAAAAAAAVRAGVNGFHEHPFMIDRVGEPMVVALTPDVPVESQGTERFIDLALPAAREALAPFSELSLNGSLSLILGIPERRKGLADNIGESLACAIGTMKEGPEISRADVIPTGHSAGLMALQEACLEIQSARAEFCLIGGVDSYLHPETLEWLDQEEQLHSSVNNWGFVPGEAAGFCLLASRRAAEKYGLLVLSSVLGVATATEENLIKTDSVCIGKGLSQAVSQVTRLLQGTDARIADTICDLNGERYRADELAFMITRASWNFVDPTSFLSPADCWGDVGAASGPLFLNLVAAAHRKGYAKGDYTLLWTSSESGARSAAMIYNPQSAS